MATVISVPITTPPLPKSWTPPKATKSSLSPPGTHALLPAGPSHLAHLRLTLHHGHSFEKHDEHAASQAAALAEAAANAEGIEDDLGVGDEEEGPELAQLDPKEWKKQDHYAVLGLSHLRYKASPDQIKIAHRKKVLKHHPDKKATTTSTNDTSLFGTTNTNDDAFFKCIQKAHEVLTNPERRRQFDSVDPEYMDAAEDEVLPKKVKDDTEFFKVFTPIFERESRFSRIQPVPMLGAVDAPKEDVHAFYDFWYNFDSWRSFEYLDKEVNEGSDNRDDKRYTEKKNKSERARRKKEDTARVRGIVDATLALDPRIKRIKAEEKAARDAKKLGSRAGTPAKKTKAEEEEEKRKQAEEAKAKEEAEKAEKADAKKAKAAAATAAKKARRAARAAEEGGGN